MLRTTRCQWNGSAGKVSTFGLFQRKRWRDHVDQPGHIKIQWPRGVFVPRGPPSELVEEIGAIRLIKFGLTRVIRTQVYFRLALWCLATSRARSSLGCLLSGVLERSWEQIVAACWLLLVGDIKVSGDVVAIGCNQAVHHSIIAGEAACAKLA